MARLARIIAPGLAHHVLQRGNRRQETFFNDGDREFYLRLLREQCDLYGVQIWSYCLMSNHVHLIVVPTHRESLAKAIGETHKRYSRMINFREGWRGYLWQDRFKSFVLDEKYLYAAVRYVERNPVRAKIVARAEDYRWSSAQARVNKEKSAILDDFYLLEQIPDWSSFLSEEEATDDLKDMRRHVMVGRPLGEVKFLEELAEKLGINFKPKKPGPKSPKALN
jgi:putative transposase